MQHPLREIIELVEALSHYSHERVDLQPRSYKQTDDRKPNGLWISSDDDGHYGWFAFSQDSDYGCADFRHNVEVDWSQIINISTPEELIKFSEEFGNIEKLGIFEIHWALVAAKYAGVVIAPHQKTHYRDMRAAWYGTWDCASGCIWDLRAITKFETA